MSISWNESVQLNVGACPVKAITELNHIGIASPVTKFAAPGPEVAIHAPFRCLNIHQLREQLLVHV